MSRGLGRRGRVALSAAILAVLAAPAFGQELNGYVEVSGLREETEQQTGDTRPVRARYDRLSQDIVLSFLHTPFPNVTLLAGGFFERDTIELDVEGVDLTTTSLRPYVRGRLRTDLFNGELGWDRNDRRRDETPRLVRDTITGTLAWTPGRTTYVQAFGSTSDEEDETRAAVDRDRTSVALEVQQRVRNWFSFYYRGSQDDVDDNVANSAVETTTHTARVQAGQSFWNRRLYLGGLYDYSKTTTETRSLGGAFVDFFLGALNGLFALDDLPGLGPLGPNPALIDRNTTAPSGINLGVPLPGGDDRPRNIGLEFQVPTTVNLVRVWIDRELPPEIARLFTWELYVSDDNDLWVRVQALPSPPLALFDNYFELPFAGPVTARFFKLVVSPLPSTLPNADQYRVIEVTELEPFVRRPAEEVAGEISIDQQRLNANGRLQILRTPDLAYEVSFQNARNEGVTVDRRLVNALSVNQPFGGFYRILARVAHEDGRQLDGDRTARVYSLVLNADPLPRLRASTIASGRREEFPFGTLDTDSVSTNITAGLYRGIDLNVGAGVTDSRRSVGRDVESAQATVLLTLVPNSRLTVSTSYQESRQELTGEGLAPLVNSNRITDLSVAYTPVSTLYLYGTWRWESRTDLEDRSTSNYSLGWSPFPYGSLRFNFTYTEQTQSDTDFVDRVYGPTVRWAINARSFVEFLYQRTMTRSEVQDIFQQTDRDIYSATLRLGF